jgi:DNA-binding XRE family transcriptional regulator
MPNATHNEREHGVEGVPTPLVPGRASVQSALVDVLEGGGSAATSEAVASVEARPTEAAPVAIAPVAAVVAKTTKAAPPVAVEDDDRPAGPRAKGERGPHENNVRKLRLERMMSKAELARRANLSVLTIDRVEKGFGCRMDSKRKILEALDLSLADRIRVFGEEE